jgi:hypothetical protein
MARIENGTFYTKECSLEAYTANKGDINGELK